MKHIYITLLVLGLSLPAALAQKQTPPTPGPAPVINIGEPASFVLKNGLKVYVVENHKVPTVSISLILDNDPILQGDKNGYVEFTGSLLRTGTKTRAKEQIDEEVDFIGAELTTFGNGLNGSALKKHLPTLLQLTSDVLLNPQFKQEELDKFKKQTLSGLASAKANPNQVEGMVRNTLLFGKNHPYGQQLTEKTIENITLADIQNYYTNYFRPNVGYLAVVGDVNTKEVKKLVKKYFGAWKKGDVPRQNVPAATPVSGNRVAIIDRPGAVQTVLSYSNIADLKPGSADAIPATVMNSILGGPYSRLMNNLREKRAYTYGAYSQLNPDKHISQFNAFTSVRNAVTDSAVAQMVLELYRMRAGQPEAAELQRAQSMVSGSFARSLESPATVAIFAINTARYNLPKDYYANYLRNVAAVTPATIQQVAQKYITPTNAYILAVGNADYIERRLTRFDADGELEYYDVNGNKVDRASLEVPAGLTADKVLDNYIQALGGRANLEKIKDITINSTITSPAASLTMTQIQKGTDKLYQSLKYGSNEVQRTVVNGTKGKALSAQQSRNLSTDEVREHKLKLGLNSILNLDKLGIKKNLIGMERLNGRAAYRVELVMPNGKRTIYYLDSETGLKLREMEIEQTTIGNATQTTDYGDYREVNGVKIPHRMLLYAGQQGVVTEVQKVEVNKNIKDDTFKLP